MNLVLQEMVDGAFARGKASAQTPEQVWDKFIAHLQEKEPLRSGLPHKNFLGSIESYRKIFIASQKD